MDNMQFLTIIGFFITLIGMMAAGFGWMIMQLFKMQKEISIIKLDVSGLRNEMINMKVEILQEIRGLDSRIAHIESYLIGSAQKTGTEKK